MKQSLNGAWQLTGDRLSAPVNAVVPGGVHVDLMAAGIIPDSFVGDNEYRVAWVHETDWSYGRKFDLLPNAGLSNPAWLVFDGLDTFTAISLNGELLAETNNMHVQYRVEVTGKLKATDNLLEVVFTSPVKAVAEDMARDPLDAPGPDMCIQGMIYARKAMCHWGWDWGPKNPTSGIWRDVYLETAPVARIAVMTLDQKHIDGKVSLSCRASIERSSQEPVKLLLVCTHPDGSEQTYETSVTGTEWLAEFEVNDPQLWWPNGYGEQPLYQLSLCLLHDGHVIDGVNKQIGLRTLELDRTPDEWGARFMVLVNGRPIWGKGGDWIPSDQYPTRVTRKHLENLLWSAKESNFNMLRCWGGAYYEDEAFYDLCDEYGLLVWQDFMFACGQYPTDPAFLANVKNEAEQVVGRLRHRACLALWCGNNEQEWMLWQGFGGKRNAEFRLEYPKIYHDVLPEVCERLDPERPYWPASPHSEGELYVDPNGEASGDAHYWEVWHGKKPFSDYRNHYFRFMSEFGFESFPDIETVRSFAKPEEENPLSYVMECHQKNSAGNGLILHYLAQTFQYPYRFDDLCYVSQLLQAEAMRYGVEHWRRNRNGYRCMGATYWQFNDIWPVASWASVDYYGRWKALQYFAKRFFQPVGLSICEQGTSASIHVTNDTRNEIIGKLRWWLENTDGQPVACGAQDVIAAPECNTELVGRDFAVELQGDARRCVMLFAELLVDEQVVSRAAVAFVPCKHLELRDPGLSVRIDGDQLVVTAQRAARFVWLRIPGKNLVFSDNYFDISAGEQRVVSVLRADEAYELGQVELRSLWDSYQP
ncbi:MAG: beta-mannosidase [Armatimonadota bacterium]